MTTTLGAMTRGTDRKMRPLLMMLAIISGFCSYQGLALVESLNGGGLIERAGTTVIAVGTSIAIYLFWTNLFGILANLWTLWARIAVLLVALTIGFPIIISSSSHPNAAGISGAAALNTEIDYRIALFEQAVAAYDEATGQLAGFQTDLALLAGRLEADETAEFERGAISGVPGLGAVHGVLTRARAQLDGLHTAIETHRTESIRLLGSAQADLLRMRETGVDETSAERLRRVRGIADKLRGTLQRMDVRPLSASIARVLEALPAEIDGLSLRLSEVAGVAQRQREALGRLRSEIGGGTATLAATGAELAASAVPIPAFEPITPMRAVAVHWRDFTTVWAIGILIDTAGVFPLLFLVIAMGERTRAEMSREAIGSLTVKELLHAKAAQELLDVDPREQFDGETIKRLTHEQFGREEDK